MYRARRWGKLGGLTVALLLALTACSGSTDAEEPPGGSGESGVPGNGMIGEDAGGEPQQTESMTLAMIGQPRSLDPAATIASSATGGTEMINVFDSLMRFDTETSTVVPQLAEDVQSDEEGTSFTITLRDGVQFSDGTPLDADAVKWSMERYGASPTAPEAAVWGASVKSITVEDEQTVVIELNYPYPGFVNLLASGPGMIVAESSGEGDDFTPIGAGPYVFESLAMGEATTLEANPNYWDGAPHTDSLRFIYIGAQEGSLEAQDRGDASIVLLSDPQLIQQQIDSGRHGYLNMTSSWAVTLINAAEGYPGSDPRVRQAMALAIDPQVVADRTFDGFGLPTNRMFPEGSTWYTPDATVPEVDLEAAKALVEEAKADGFDGNIEYMCTSDPVSKDRCLALKAQWDSAGFTTTINHARSVADIITAIIGKDYDATMWGINFRESDPYAKFAALMHSSGTQTYGMYTSPEMDTLIEEFRAAPSEEEAHSLMTEIETKFHEDVPWISHVGSWDFNTWQGDKVHGVKGAATGMILLGDAWVTE